MPRNSFSSCAVKQWQWCFTELSVPTERAKLFTKKCCHHGHRSVPPPQLCITSCSVTVIMAGPVFSKFHFHFPLLEFAVAQRKPLLAREIHWCTNQMEQKQHYRLPQMSSAAIIPLLQGLFCIRKMNSFSLNAFSTSSYCDISPLQKPSVITCEEGDLYSQGSQLVDPNLVFRWGCKMDLIQFQYSSQTNSFFFLKEKNLNNINFGNL